LRSAHDHELEDWEKCILGFIWVKTRIKDVVAMKSSRAVVSWAKENPGLRQKDVHQKSDIWRHLEVALNQIIKDKNVKQTIFYGVERLRLVD
jgi:hypothetical protein